MFEEISGLPMHPLLVHAAVVFVPLLAVVAVLYAAVPKVRAHTRWVLGALAVVTPGAALFAKLSGDAFYKRLNSRGAISAEYLGRLQDHADFGTYTLFATLVLALAAIGLVLFVPPPGGIAVGGVATGGKALPLALSGLSVVLAIVAVYYVVRTGDSGAKAVWEGQ
jgi:hypothetical protein